MNVYIAMPYRLGDGRFTSTVITSRLIRKYQKPFVAPANNIPGANITLEEGNAQWAFAVGAYESKESYRINDGYLLRHEDNFHHVGSWGPNGVGAIKPDIVVPSGYLSSGLPNAGDGGVKGLFRLPPGYGIGGGTSQATPTMAGAIALLMSAAKQEGVPYDAERVHRAMTDSARQIPNLKAHQQGAGAVDVAAAFELLKAYAKSPGLIKIESRAPVRTPYSSWLATPNEGVGLWESEGWRAGERGGRVVTLFRETGPAEPMSFDVTWTGNDGAFSSASKVTLPLRAPVRFPVTVAPATAGTHSALLTLDHPSVPGHAHRMMTTVVAAESFEKGDDFSLARKEKLERPGPYSFDLAVPEEVGALNLSGTGGTLTLLDPIGRPKWFTGMSATAPWPAAGVWQAVLRLNADALDLAWTVRPGELAPRVYTTLNITPIGVRIDAPASLALESGGARTVEVTVRNIYGAFTGGLTSAAIGAARSVQLRLKPRQQKVFEVTAPEGSPLLYAEINGAARAGGVDLYLFDCTGKRCKPAGTALDLGAPPRMRQPNPKPGLWKVVVDASRAPADGVTVEYLDLIADPALGGVSAADGARQHKVGEQWTAQANVWLAKRPEPGRSARALFVVTASTGATYSPVGIQMTPIGASGNALKQ
jgi:hypothetical protein